MMFNNLSLKGVLALTIVIAIHARFINADEQTTAAPATTTLETEAVTGCPPPDFKISRGKYKSMTTESPFVTFETTQLYLPQDFTTNDLEFIDGKVKDSGGEQVDRSAQKDSSKVKENPFWFEDIIRDAEQHYNHPDNAQHHHSHHHNQRVKRNHHKKSVRHVDNEKMLAKRSVEYQEEDYPQDEVFSASEVVGNIFNENDTLTSLEGGKYNDLDMYDLEDILGELKELEGKNRFQEGDIISKSSNKRVKRKSGKTTSALNRPKSQDSKKSSSNRKSHGQIDEEGPYAIDSDEEEMPSKEKDKDSEEIDEPESHGIFREVSEVRFPAEVGPLGTHRLCKIRCIDGMWQGPLCAAPDESESGLLKFEPLYRRCVVDQIPPHLLLSYKNVSVTLNWDLPHGHTLQARCEDLGLYKLVGEAKVLCSNGLWAPKLPQCVPTTLLTNYSDDSPPSIRIKVGVGSAAYEPSGVLAVLPASTLHLDCMYPRRKGSPEWSWTGWFRQYLTGWSAVPEEKATRYRLSIKDVQPQDSGTYTCASPRGLTNSIIIQVAVSQCATLTEPNAPLSLRLEGIKLGQRAIYRCPMGYILQGTANATCLASGNWSSPAPTCLPIQCPPLFLEDPHLSLIELNTSAWGRAVFSCSWGYRLSGPPNLECLASGHWSGPIPRCRGRSQCSYPGDPPNGLIAPLKFFYDPGDFLTVQCRPGFIEHGANGQPPERPKCMPDGSWSAKVSSCKSYEEV